MCYLFVCGNSNYRIFSEDSQQNLAIFSELTKNNIGGENLIYENICKMAKKRGISINKLEEKAGLSTGSICKWGKSVSPTVKSIKKVSDILGCTVDDLISEKKSRKKQ